MAAAPHLGGARRLARGSLASAAAVGTAVVAHAAAGHHPPHPVVVVLALAVSLPLCTALAAVRFGRLRLAASVLASQAVLHGLFSLLPASAGATAAGGSALGGPHADHGHAAPPAGSVPDAGHGTTTAPSAPAAEAALPALPVPGGMLDVGMAVSHLAAAVLTIAALRRGELILQAFSDLLSLRPARILMTPRAAHFGVRAARPTPGGPVLPLADLWAGRGPCTVRGPPVPA